MTILIVMLIAGVIDALLLLADAWINGLWDLAFNVSTQIPVNWFSMFLQYTQDTLFYVAVSLLVVKFLKKIFDIYVLWVDGDPDTEPIQLVVNFARALITAIAFKYVWGIFVDLGDEVLISILSNITGTAGSLIDQWGNAMWGSLGLVPAIFGLVFIIALFFMHVKFIGRGLEVAFMICGAPLACIGLMDNDHGFFKPYCTQLIKLIITTIFQIVCVRLSVAIALSASLANGIDALIWGIGVLWFSSKIPAILQEFMIPQPHTGGIIQKVHSVAMIGSIVRRAV